MMELPSSTSFSPLGTIHLSAPHVLHPEACNPAMDLVALLGVSGGEANSSKGKGKALTGNSTRVALWRMSGSKVWEADVEGRVCGLAWTGDGLHLSILVIKPPTTTETERATVDHLSVHTGETVKTVPVDLDPQASSSTGSQEGWWEMKWAPSDMDWPVAGNGSAIKIIESLPRVTAVDPPQAASIHPFMLPNAAKTKKTSVVSSHTKLDRFPALLPTTVPSSPDILCITSPDGASSKRLLTGTLPLGRGTRGNSPTLRSAQSCNWLEGFLNTILRGMEAIEHAFKEGEKQTMIWREELETCAEQQGMSYPDVHADLFRLLVTGRAGVAVTEWLGNRLTGRTIAKWEMSLETSFTTIRKILGESVGPALERIVLILEEFRGWSKVPEFAHLQLDQNRIRSTLGVSLGFAKLVERMRQQAEEEMYASAEWIKWLKFEIARAAASQDISTDSFLPSLCDTKLVWHYMKCGFIKSPFLIHHPQQFRARPPTDLLPPAYEPYPKSPTRKLAEVLEETLQRLDGSAMTGPEGRGELSPIIKDTSIDSSMAMTPVDNSITLPSSPEIPSSPDTVDNKMPLGAESEDPPRVLELEPWVWANTLITDLQDLVRSKDVSDVDVGDNGNEWVSIFGRQVVKRTVSGEEYTAALVTESHPTLTVIKSGTSWELVSFGLDDWSILAISFFDDVELAILLQSPTGERYLGTIEYISAPFVPIEPISNRVELVEALAQQEMVPLPLARCRYLKTVTHVEESEGISIALNGRTGRRVGCISMGDGREVEVLDMDEDEDEEEEEEDADMSGVIEE